MCAVDIKRWIFLELLLVISVAFCQFTTLPPTTNPDTSYLDMELPAPSVSLVFSALGLLLLSRLVYLAATRLYLHPLARVPGNKLAALTHLYECYYDAVLEGKFIWKLEEFHQQYGRSR